MAPLSVPIHVSVQIIMHLDQSLSFKLSLPLDALLTLNLYAFQFVL